MIRKLYTFPDRNIDRQFQEVILKAVTDYDSPVFAELRLWDSVTGEYVKLTFDENGFVVKAPSPATDHSLTADGEILTADGEPITW